MFAMVCSFLLSRTLVPTMAKYLLHMHVPRTASTATAPPPSRNPLVRFQHGFEDRFMRLRTAIVGLLALAIEHRACSSAGFVGFIVVSFALAPFLGRNFFPAGRRRSDADSRPRAGRHAHRGNAARFTAVEKAIREVIPPAEVAAMVDNIGTYLSSINTIYNNTGTIGESDGDIQISLEEGHAPDGRLCQPPAQRAAPALSRAYILVPAGRHRQPDPEFRRARADRSAGASATTSARISPTPTGFCADAPRQRGGRCAHPAIAALPTLEVNIDRTRAAIHRRDRGRCDQQPGREPGRLLARSRPPTGSTRRTALPIRSRCKRRSTGSTRSPRCRICRSTPPGADHRARRNRRHRAHPQQRGGFAVRHRPHGADLRDHRGTRSRRRLGRHP